MVRSLTLIPAILCAAAIVSAQAPANYPPPAQQPAAPAAQQPMPSERPGTTTEKVTYTGCVKAGTTPGSFILENADLTPAASAPAAQTTPGAVGTSGATKPTLNLTPKAGIDLKAHMNHKIAVVGMMAPKKSTEASEAPAGQPAAKPAQEFNVDSFKMVSTSCS